MKLHKMLVNRAIYGPNREKITESIQVLADPSETLGIYHNKSDKAARFILTHIPTGYKSGSSATQRGARELIGRLLALPVDWTEADADRLKESLSSGGVAGQVRQIISQYR